MARARTIGYDGSSKFVRYRCGSPTPKNPGTGPGPERDAPAFIPGSDPDCHDSVLSDLFHARLATVTTE